MILHWHPGIRNFKDFLITIKNWEMPGNNETTKQQNNPPKNPPPNEPQLPWLPWLLGSEPSVSSNYRPGSEKGHTDDTVDGQILQTPRKGLDDTPFPQMSKLNNVCGTCHAVGFDLFCPPISTLARRKQLWNLGGAGDKVAQGLNNLSIHCMDQTPRESVHTSSKSIVNPKIYMFDCYKCYIAAIMAAMAQVSASTRLSLQLILRCLECQYKGSSTGHHDLPMRCQCFYKLDKSQPFHLGLQTILVIFGYRPWMQHRLLPILLIPLQFLCALWAKDILYNHGDSLSSGGFFCSCTHCMW